MPENTTRIVGTFKCPRGHTFETVQTPIMTAPCQEPECGAEARRQATHFEPSPLVSTAVVRLALTRAADWMQASTTTVNAPGLARPYVVIKELHKLLSEVFAVTEGVKLEPPPELQAPGTMPTPADRLLRLRADGWMVVACHDYHRQAGERMVIWALANGPHFISGDGATDDEALGICERAAVFIKRTHA